MPFLQTIGNALKQIIEKKNKQRFLGPDSKSKIFNGLKQSTSKPADNDARQLSFLSTVIGNWHRLIVLNTYMYLMRIIIVHMYVENKILLSYHSNITSMSKQIVCQLQGSH